MTDEFYSDCIYLISEATISRISEMYLLDSAYPVPVPHFSELDSNSSYPLSTWLLCEST